MTGEMSRGAWVVAERERESDSERVRVRGQEREQQSCAVGKGGDR